nr:unnamed protein product [Spirometra erinaceieuropaei]
MGDATINNNDNNADKRTEAVAPTSDEAPPNSEPKAEEPNAQTNEEKPNGIEAGQTEGDGEMNVEHDTNEVKPIDVDELPLDAKPRHSISSVAESKDTFAEDYVFECTKRGVVPLGYYIRHMRDSELVMRHADISPEDFRPLAISLSQSKFITKLDLSHNWLGDESVSALCQLFSENVFIEHLSLADNRFTDAKTEEMCDTLASVAQLTWLDLSENFFSDESANFFSDLMAATTIFAAGEDIREGQLVIFPLLHRKLNVWEDGVEMFFECQHLIPFDDDESVIHIPSPEFRSVMSENQRLQPL